jgi:haloalkane dehalogenase
MVEYRRPFLEPRDSRLATLVWPREVPLDGQPADVAARIAAYSWWLAASLIPKLFINADPGVFIQGGTHEFCRSWPNQTEVTVPGMHFVQEDSPELVGQAVAGWYGTLS